MKILEAFRDLRFYYGDWIVGFLQQSFTSQAENPRERQMKTEISIRTNAIKKITAAVLGWLCIAAWLAAVIYFSFTMEF